MQYIKQIMLLVILTISWKCQAEEVKEIWLDELGESSYYIQDWGLPRINKAVTMTPLTVKGIVYERGIGTHAISRMLFDIGKKAKTLSGLAGADDNTPFACNLQFKILGDRKELWRSGIMRKGDPAKPFNIDLSGIDKVLLLVEECGDGMMYDRADWLNVKFTTLGDVQPIPVWPKPIAKEKYILTPQSPDAPQINNPLTYGARPGNPFLMPIMVSGKRPMTYKAKGLPKGLKLNRKTGLITGSTNTNGNFKVRLQATNEKGTDEKEITLKIGSEIMLTPPMGWNSWNIFGADIDDKKIRRMADRMVELGLVNYGYAYINIDDGWQGVRGGKYNAIMPNDKFPDMKGLVDYVHSKGLKIGIYSSPWVQTFAGYIGSSADTRNGKVVNSSRRYGEFSFAKNDVKQWAEWGFDYIKYDWVTNDIAHTAELSYLLRQSGRDILYSISNAAPFELAEDWSNLTNVWRTTGDIYDSWCSMTTIGFLQDKWQPFAKPGSWNDPDMLIVGKVGWGKNIHSTHLSPDEQYTHITLWSILAAPLLIGCDLEQMDDFTMNLLSNREVIAINQDIAGIQGSRVYADNNKEIEVWSKPLKDGSIAVGLFNLSDNKQDISIFWDQLNIQGKQKVRNLWEQKDKGVYINKYQSDVPSHGVLFIKIEPVK